MIGSDARQVTVALTLAALPATPATPEQALVDYTMSFTVGGETAFLTAPAHDGAAASFGIQIAFRPIVLGPARVVRDRARRELRVTAPIAAFAPYVDLRPGGTATDLSALVAVTPSVPGAPPVAQLRTLTVDVADSNATYELGSRSCVPVGR